jgi:hypothetical protein
MNKGVLLALALAPLLAFAQKEPKAVQSRPPGAITRMIRLQHADPCLVRNLLLNTGAQASCDKVLNVVVVSGTPADVAFLEQTAKELDAETARFRSSNVQMTVYVVGASPNAAGAGPIPQGLQATVNQLKQLFPYASYQLLETIVTRARLGERAFAQGMFEALKGQAGAPPSTYDVSFLVGGISNSASSAAVHINDFKFNSRVPYVTGAIGNATTQYQTGPASVNTNIDITADQKVVVGKAGAGGSNAIFLIVEAKVVD